MSSLRPTFKDLNGGRRRSRTSDLPCKIGVPRKQVFLETPELKLFPQWRMRCLPFRSGAREPSSVRKYSRLTGANLLIPYFALPSPLICDIFLLTAKELMFYNAPITSGLHVHSSRPNSRAANSIHRAAHLWADSFELIADCTKLLTSPGKLNIRKHSVGTPATGGCSDP